MKTKDKLEAFIACTIILTYVGLIIFGRVSADGFVAIAVYVIKKFLDGVEEERKNGNA